VLKNSHINMCLFLPATLLVHPTNSNQTVKQYTDSTAVQTKYSHLYITQVAEI